jgi:hypothetical protein
MPTRIYALAKDLKIDSKELTELCGKAGIPGKGSALASLEDDEVVKLKVFLEGSCRRAADSDLPQTEQLPSATAPAALPPPPPPDGLDRVSPPLSLEKAKYIQPRYLQVVELHTILEVLLGVLAPNQRPRRIGGLEGPESVTAQRLDQAKRRGWLTDVEKIHESRRVRNEIVHRQLSVGFPVERQILEACDNLVEAIEKLLLKVDPDIALRFQ